MANEKKNGAHADKKEALRAEEKQYRVVHTIVLGKGETREQRSRGFVTASEVGGEAAIESLLRIGTISDPDALMRPSEASEQRTRAFAIDIAQQGGVVTREGERYSIGERVIGDADALAQLPLSELSAALIAALQAARSES
jgi:hypothetical protein